MSEKFKFKIPSADELSKDDKVVKSMTLFENYKKQKDTVVDKIQEPVQNTGQGVSAAVPYTSKITNQSSIQKTSAPAPKPQPPKPVAVGSSTVTVVPQPSTSRSAESTETKAQPSKAASSSSIIVNFRQRGNPILKHIRNVPWEYNSIIPDYVMGKATCALYLSLRYHQLNPQYIHNRLKELGKGYDLRVLLAQVDVKDPHHLLKDLAKICILADLTLILAFSPEEAGRYLETYKVYENKPPDVLMEKIEKDYVSKLTDTLTSVKSVNKTDSMTLLSTFKTTQGIINASKEDLSLCAGFGPQKAQRLYDVFHEPFLKSRKRLTEQSAEPDSDAKKKR